MKKFKNFAGKIVDSITQDDDGKNSYFVIKFTDGTKINIVGYISDDKNNKINLKAKTYESSNNSKLYIEENISDYMKKTKKLDESFVSITINIGKDDEVIQTSNLPQSVVGTFDVEVPEDEDVEEVDVESEESEDFDDEESEDFDDEESEDFDDEESEEDFDDEESEDFDDEESYDIEKNDDEESEDEIIEDDEASYDEEDFDEDEDFDDEESEEDFDEDEDFDEVDVESIKDDEEEVIEDDDEEIIDGDIEAVLTNQLLSPEYNRETYKFKENKSGEDFEGVVLGKLSAGNFLFKTEDGIKKAHYSNVYED